MMFFVVKLYQVTIWLATSPSPIFKELSATDHEVDTNLEYIVLSF